MLLNTVFQLILEKVYATCEDWKVELLNSTGCEWSLGHLEYTDYLCPIINSIGHAEQLLGRYKLILGKYAVEIPNE